MTDSPFADVIKREKNLLNQIKEIAKTTIDNHRVEKLRRLLQKKTYARLFSMIYLYLRKYENKIGVYQLSLLTGITKTNIYKYLEQLCKLGLIKIKTYQTMKRYKPVKYIIIADLLMFEDNIEFALSTLKTTLEQEERRKIFKDCFLNKLINDEDENTIYVWEKQNAFTGKMVREEGNINLLLTRMRASKELGLKFRVLGKKENMIQYE